MSPVEFGPTISAGERPQTHPLDRAATGTGVGYFTFCYLPLKIPSQISDAMGKCLKIDKTP